jgi:hypothetical protein
MIRRKPAAALLNASRRAVPRLQSCTFTETGQARTAPGLAPSLVTTYTLLRLAETDRSSKPTPRLSSPLSSRPSSTYTLTGVWGMRGQRTNTGQASPASGVSAPEPVASGGL